jgi:hypothetical protein
MEPRAQPPSFSLLGGPLHRIGTRATLVRHHSNTVALGLALGLMLWIVMVLLCLAEGLTDKVFSFGGLGTHVRLLIAIPLMFLCESVLDPCVSKFVETLELGEILSKEGVVRLRAEIARLMRWQNAWLPELVLLIVALSLVRAGSPLQWFGSSTGTDASRSLWENTLSGHWYFGICLTLMRFLILRWLWRLALWCHFLWRLSRLDMNLVPTHPDGQAGLGYLQTVHAQFAPLILAVSAIQSSAFAEDLALGKIQFEAIFPPVVLLVCVMGCLFLGPLLILAPNLWEARLAGLESYMTLASQYVHAFDRKWLRTPGGPEESFLGTADLQSLADLQNSLGSIEGMRWIPIGQRLLTGTVAAVLLPMLPLILFKYPITELIQKLVAGMFAL